jgi:hypothetical protein
MLSHQNQTQKVEIFVLKLVATMSQTMGFTNFEILNVMGEWLILVVWKLLASRHGPKPAVLVEVLHFVLGHSRQVAV